MFTEQKNQQFVAMGKPTYIDIDGSVLIHLLLGWVWIQRRCFFVVCMWLSCWDRFRRRVCIGSGVGMRHISSWTCVYPSAQNDRKLVWRRSEWIDDLFLFLLFLPILINSSLWGGNLRSHFGSGAVGRSAGAKGTMAPKTGNKGGVNVLQAQAASVIANKRRRLEKLADVNLQINKQLHVPQGITSQALAHIEYAECPSSLDIQDLQECLLSPSTVKALY